MLNIFIRFILPLVLMLGSLAGIYLIVKKRLPQLIDLNLENSNAAKEAELKRLLTEERLRRKFSVFGQRVMLAINPFLKIVGELIKTIGERVGELENKYKEQVQRRRLEKISSQKRQQKLTAALVKAEEYESQNDFEQAEEVYIEALKFDPKNIKVYRKLAQLYFKQKNFDYAKEIFEHILKINKYEASAYAGLGYIAQMKSDWEKAQANFKKSVELNSEVAAYHISLGFAYQALGEWENALQSFSRACQLEPNNPKNLDFLLESAILVGDKILARQTLRRLEKVNPENQKLKSFRQRLAKMSNPNSIKRIS